jgi:adenylosuccinate synthase
MEKNRLFTSSSEDQFNIKPIYKTFPGWKTKTQGIRNLKDLTR